MVACPQCHFTNPAGMTSCVRCGSVTDAPLTLAMSALLPPRMVEPIDTPTEAPLDGLACPKRLAVGCSGVTTPGPDLCRTAEATPLPATTRDRPAPGGTIPAYPGLSGHPMNDSAVLNPPTVPATHRADQPPAPVPTAPPLKPKLVVLRGVRINAEYPIYEGRNTIGRFADKPVDIDLLSQESVEQIWCSRQHAAVYFEQGIISVEDNNSLNGTWVNGSRIPSGQRRAIKAGDVIQIGTVQLKLVLV